MENEFYLTTEKLPEKGKDIIGIDDRGNKHFCYRCNYHNPNCMEWSSIFGGAIMVNIIKWKYEN